MLEYAITFFLICAGIALIAPIIGGIGLLIFIFFKS